MTQTLYAGDGKGVATQVAAARQSSAGWISALWLDEQLQRVSIGNATRRGALAALGAGDAMDDADDEQLTPQQFSLLHRLQAAADGEEVDFSDVTLDLSHLRPFARRVVERCRRIRIGQTMSYGELASACDSPNAARAVGNVMRTNRFPLIVPCHRVVGSGGSLGGFSAPTGIELKRRLLQAEGAIEPDAK